MTQEERPHTMTVELYNSQVLTKQSSETHATVVASGSLKRSHVAIARKDEARKEDANKKRQVDEPVNVTRDMRANAADARKPSQASTGIGDVSCTREAAKKTRPVQTGEELFGTHRKRDLRATLEESRRRQKANASSSQVQASSSQATASTTIASRPIAFTPLKKMAPHAT